MAIENQREKIAVPFLAWTVETGQWGGRAPGTPEALAEESDPTSNITPEPAEMAATLHAWMGKSEAAPFSAHPPESLLQSVPEILEHDNACLAQEHGHALMTAHSDRTNLPSPSVATEDMHAERRWSVGPTNEWRQVCSRDINFIIFLMLRIS